MAGPATLNENSSPAAGGVVIVGGAGGVGRALASVLIARGTRVVVTSRDAARAQAACDELGAIPMTLDPADFDATVKAFEQASEECGGLSGAANCAGSILLKPAHLTSWDDWQATWHANATTAFSVARAAGRVMKEGGSVALVSSVAGSTGLSNHEAIASAKAAVEGLTRAAAATYAGRGLRFNAVAPGLVRSPMSERITGNPKSLAASEAMHPLGRIGEPGEIADVLAWLLSPASAWVTGQVLAVDGGLSTVRTRG